MSTAWTVVVVAAAVGVGFYAGAKYCQREVHTGATGAIDDLLGRVGVNVHDGYGRVAHTLADTIVGEVLGG